MAGFRWIEGKPAFIYPHSLKNRTYIFVATFGNFTTLEFSALVEA